MSILQGERTVTGNVKRNQCGHGNNCEEKEKGTSDLRRKWEIQVVEALTREEGGKEIEKEGGKLINCKDV